MTIDGKKIADELVALMRSFVESNNLAPRLVAIAVDPDIPTQQFLRIKAKVAERVGIGMETKVLARDAMLVDVERVYVDVLQRADGIVLQLPFPQTVAIETLLGNLPSDLDPDCLGVASGALLREGVHVILPPVISALQLLTQKYTIPLKGMRAVVVGQGRLVGAPASLWLENQGAEVVRLTKKDSLDALKTADIVVLGAGVPGLVRPGMLKDEVIIFDAGASEESGKIVGDADVACAEKASFFTPVPGGIGPLAVAELFGNLLSLKFDYRR